MKRRGRYDCIAVLASETGEPSGGILRRLKEHSTSPSPRPMANTETDYVLGTHDEEIARLGLQHRVWRPRVLAAWQRARFTAGMTVADVGCGPGFATLDLAEVVGPRGRVVGFDRSHRFLAHVRASAASRGFRNVEAHDVDLDTGVLPAMQVDGAWCRWVLAFLSKPRRLVTQIASLIRPGGVFVSYEYFSYETWRFLPPSDEHDDFVRMVCASWREEGGEPNVGLQLPQWLHESGFEIVDARPAIDVLTPDDDLWQWPESFVQVGSARFADRGVISASRRDEITDAFERRKREPSTRMITPGVLELIARKI